MDDVISSCEQTAADVRAHRREAPKKAVDGEQAVARDAESGT